MPRTAHIRKNDPVLVIAGKDRGKKGKVLRVILGKHQAVVEGIALIKRHTKPNPQKSIKGGIVEKEMPVAISNLMVVCPECDKPSRTGSRRLEDGRKIRVCIKCNGEIDK
jgi:large subunit ribosomal protein L24